MPLYTDWKNMHVREPTEKEQLHGKVPVKQGQSVSATRAPGGSQCSICAGRGGAAGLSAQGEFEQVFRLETERSIFNDCVVRYENRYFQLERSTGCPPRQANGANGRNFAQTPEEVAESPGGWRTVQEKGVAVGVERPGEG